VTRSPEAQREREATRVRSRGTATASVLAAALAIGCARQDAATADLARSSAPATAAELGAAAEVEATAKLEARVRELEDELARARAKEEDVAREHQVALSALRTELRQAAESRMQREQEWQRYVQTVGKLAAITGPELPKFAPADAEAERAPAASATAAAEPAAHEDAEAAHHERSHEVVLALRSLLTIEEVAGLDIVDPGALGDGWVGPVVLRMRDGSGRPVGTLCADRLRLEGSVAARTLTIVLEHGYERRGMTRYPFGGGASVPDAAPDAGSDSSGGRAGVRRIELPDVDPNRWIDAMPELFAHLATSQRLDDGKWDLRALRANLNVLLREDAANGYYRLRGMGGVVGSVLSDVALDQLDRDGRMLCKLFADRMYVVCEGRSVELVLESGARVTSDTKTPFLDGRCRIILPRADADAWRAAGIPGLSEPPPHEKL